MKLLQHPHLLLYQNYARVDPARMEGPALKLWASACVCVQKV